MYIIENDKELLDKNIKKCYIGGYKRISTELGFKTCQVIYTGDGGLYVNELCMAEDNSLEYYICPLSKETIIRLLKTNIEFRGIFDKLGILNEVMGLTIENEKN